MDILRLLEDLKNLIDGTPSFGPLTWGLNRDEIDLRLAKIRASLPKEVKDAASTIRDSERIMETAREDATMTLDAARKEAQRIVTEAHEESQRILEAARVQQERMVADNEILKLTKAQSEELRASADREAAHMRRGAEKYAYDVLSQLGSVLDKMQTSVERGKEEIQKAEAPASAPRNHTRV